MRDLERVVLWSNLLVEIATKDRHLLHDVVAHARYLGEEEEGEESSNTAEAASKSTAVIDQLCTSDLTSCEEGRSEARGLRLPTIKAELRLAYEAV